MTVAELIELLKAMPPEMEAVVRGYESGYDIIKDVRPVKAIDDPGAWYDGRYGREGEFLREGPEIELVYIQELIKR